MCTNINYHITVAGEIYLNVLNIIQDKSIIYLDTVHTNNHLILW